MLATLLNMPKWLVALIALCVLAGYSEQVKCKLVGCEPTTVATKTEPGKDGSKPHPVEGEQDCHCQCHFTTLIAGEVPAIHTSFLRVVGSEPSVWIDRAPEAPCADVEHPPQLA